MFSMPSGPELIFVVGLALIVFGPKKLPEIGRTIGQGLRELRKASREITDAFDVSDVTSSLPRVSDFLNDDEDRPDRSSDPDPEPEPESDFEPDRMWSDESDTDVETEKETEQDAANSAGDTERTGIVDSPTGGGSAVWSEEAAGDRQVDG